MVVDIREDLGSEILVHFGVEAPPVRGADVQAAMGEDALEATSEQVRRKGSLFTARVSAWTRFRASDDWLGASAMCRGRRVGWPGGPQAT